MECCCISSLITDCNVISLTLHPYVQNHQKDKGAIAAARMHVMGEAEKKLHEVHSPKAKANEEAAKKAAEHQLLLAREVL